MQNAISHHPPVPEQWQLPIPRQLPSFIAQHNATWNRIYLLARLASSPGSVSSQLLVPLRLLAGRTVWEAETSLHSTAQQPLKHVINVILILNSKHSMVTATVENIISVETRIGASLPVHVSASLETTTLSHNHKWSPAYLWVERWGRDRDNVIARDSANLAAQGHEQSDPALVLVLLLVQGWTGGFEWYFLVKIVLWNYYWI